MRECEKRVSFIIDKGTWEKFRRRCGAIHSNPSRELRAFARRADGITSDDIEGVKEDGREKEKDTSGNKDPGMVGV